MEKQFIFTEMLFNDLKKNIQKNLKNKKDAKGGYPWGNYMNRDCGKVALKRKITYLRQELLNLEKMIDND